MANEDARTSSTAPKPPDTPSPAAAPPLSVRLQIATIGKLNLADFQNAVHALRELAVVNGTEAVLTELTLSVTSEPAFLQPRTWHLDTVGAGATYRLSELYVKLEGALLTRLRTHISELLHSAMTLTYGSFINKKGWICLAHRDDK